MVWTLSYHLEKLLLMFVLLALVAALALHNSQWDQSQEDVQMNQSLLQVCLLLKKNYVYTQLTKLYVIVSAESMHSFLVR